MSWAWTETTDDPLKTILRRPLSGTVIRFPRFRRHTKTLSPGVLNLTVADALYAYAVTRQRFPNPDAAPLRRIWRCSWEASSTGRE
jgi:hypothetical protein